MRALVLGVVGIHAVTVEQTQDAVRHLAINDDDDDDDNGSDAATAIATEPKISSGPVAQLQAEMALVESEVKKTGITPQVKRALDALRTMIVKKIEPAIKEGHHTDALLMATIHREIVTCDGNYGRYCSGKHVKCEANMQVKKRACDEANAAAGHTRKKFDACVAKRNKLVAFNQTKCCREYAMCPGGDCEHVKLSKGFATCDFRTETGKECFKAAHRLVGSLKGYFRGQDAKYETYRKECAITRTAAEGQIADCQALHLDLKQKVAAAAQCKKTLDASCSACTSLGNSKFHAFNKCRKTMEASFSKAVGPCQKERCSKKGKHKFYGTRVGRGAYYGKSDCKDSGGACVLNRCEDRRDEWKATQIIKCMLKQYREGGKLQRSELRRCEETISTIYLHCKVPPTPKKRQECKVVCKHCKVPGLPGLPPPRYPAPCYGPPPPKKVMCVDPPTPSSKYNAFVLGECPGWCRKTAASMPS